MAQFAVTASKVAVQKHVCAMLTGKECDCKGFLCHLGDCPEYKDPSDLQEKLLQDKYYSVAFDEMATLDEMIGSTRSNLLLCLELVRNIPVFLLNCECKSGVYKFMEMLEDAGMELCSRSQTLLNLEAYPTFKKLLPCHYTHQCIMQCMRDRKDNTVYIARVMAWHLRYFLTKVNTDYAHIYDPLFHNELAATLNTVKTIVSCFERDFVEGDICGNWDPEHHHHADTLNRIFADLHKPILLEANCDCCICDDLTGEDCKCMHCMPELYIIDPK